MGSGDGALSGVTLRRAGVLLGYGVMGAAVTAAIALVVLNLAQPVQRVVYDLFYLRVGPSEATETAILTYFLVAGVVALTAALLVGDYLSDRGAHLSTLAWAVVALLGLVAVFLVVALAGLAAFLTAIIVLAVGLIFALSGVRLLYKRTENLLAVVQFAFVGFIAAPVEAYPVLKLFPLALGSDLLRQVMNTSARLWEVPPADLALLAGTVIGYLALGYVGFRNSMQKARDRGVLGHY